MSVLIVTVFQSNLIWEDPPANRKMFSEKIDRLAEPTDLIILPEMFTTGFSMNARKLAETMDGESVQWMRRYAKKKKAMVMGSLIIEEDGQFFNRLIAMRPDGSLSFYDKRHLFTLAGEHAHYRKGTRRLILDYKGWKICPLICYDLRFPVWSRNTEDYDLLIYVANWPVKRSHHWKSLLRARAIENQSYTIGVNRCGEDAGGYYYSGDTSVIDFGGNIHFQVAHTEAAFTTSLSLEKQTAFRKRLDFLPDRDNFEIKDE
ncbi:MAG: amidohydrolase [Bacteroidetes bacterium]|nr:MAG: amidohydrolase [Bacteroidota bacterium]